MTGDGKTGIRRIIAAGIAAVALAVAPETAFADVGPMPNPGYEIEAKALYCEHGGIACGQSASTIADLRFVEVDADRFEPGTTGQPDLVHVVCGQHVLDAREHPDVRLMEATVGPASLQDPESGVHPGSLTGFRRVANTDESSPAASGQSAATANDSVTHTLAQVAGVDVSNSPQDTLVAGGFPVRLVGTAVDLGTGQRSQAVMQCRTNVTPVPSVAPSLVPFPPAPNTFENVSPDTDGDATS